MSLQIVAVVVLYKRAPEDSQTLVSLDRAFARNPALAESVSVLLWDNSPEPLERLDPSKFRFPVEYRHTEQNAGVSGAYNRAMEYADAQGCPWLLLLDHDTELPENFLPRMLEYSRELEDRPEVASIAPFVRRHDAAVYFSPTRILSFNRVRQLPPGWTGLYPHDVLAINSGSLMRVEGLKEIGGYSEEFWLDLSDIYVYHRLYQAGKRLFVAGDLEIRHACAMLDYTKEMSPERYWNYIAAEDAYYILCKPWLEAAAQPLRLLARTWRQYARYRNKAFSRITLAYFFRLLLKSRTRRLELWREQMRRREIPATPVAS